MEEFIQSEETVSHFVEKEKRQSKSKPNHIQPKPLS